MFCLYILPLARTAQAKIQMLTTSRRIVTILLKSLGLLTILIKLVKWSLLLKTAAHGDQFSFQNHISGSGGIQKYYFNSAPIIILRAQLSSTYYFWHLREAKVRFSRYKYLLTYYRSEFNESEVNKSEIIWRKGEKQWEFINSICNQSDCLSDDCLMTRFTSWINFNALMLRHS